MGFGFLRSAHALALPIAVSLLSAGQAVAGGSERCDQITSRSVEFPTAPGSISPIRLRTVSNTGASLFSSGRAEVNPDFEPTLRCIGGALNKTAGAILVLGYSDNQPISTPRFPDKLELTRGRAAAIAGRLSSYMDEPSRLSVEGRGASNPIADNITPSGRALNRRIEIVLVSQSGGTE